MAPAQSDLSVEFEGLQSGAVNLAPKPKNLGTLIKAYLDRFFAHLRHYG